MSHLWNIPDETPEAACEEIVETSINPLEVAMMSLILCEKNLPMTTSINEELSMFIEKRTRGQRKNPLWHQLHRGRLTSSLFGAIMHAGEKPCSLINQILQGSYLDKYPKLPKAVQWGIDHEDQAKFDYLRLQSAVTDVKIEESGLTLYLSHSFLGASNDGWVIDNSKPEEVKWGCLEVKCPFSINGNQVIDTPVEQLVQYKEFCLEETEDGARHLKQHHPYYAQVQGEMAIMNVTWCDFVLWTNATEATCFIERIQFDSNFVSEMMPKLFEFFVSHILSHYENQFI